MTPGWRIPMAIAIIAGGIGGIWPVAAMGEPGSGLLAGFLNGVTTSASVAFIWLPPLVAVVLCTQRELGWTSVRVTQGMAFSCLRRRWHVDASLLVVSALVAAGIAGIYGFALGNVFSPGEWSMGTAGARSTTEIATSAVQVAGVFGLTAAVCRLLQARQLALAVLLGSQLVTLVVLAILYFAPVLRPAQALSPWVGLWPLRTSEAMSPLLATTVSRPVGYIITAAWLTCFALGSRFRPDSPLAPGR